MSDNFETYRQSLRSWIIKKFPDNKVFFSELNADQPNDPYFTIKLIRVKRLPHPVETIISADEETIAGYFRLFFSVKFIGGTDPQSYLSKLSNSLRSISAELFFYGAEMGVCGLDGDILDLPSVEGQEWEERAATTLVFDVIVTDTFTPEVSTSAEVTINDDDPVIISGD